MKRDDVDELLRPVFDIFKRRAEAAIKDAVARVENILRVSYAPVAAQIPTGLPAPRLQMRWEKGDRFNCDWLCHYELVFPLKDIDVRNTDNGKLGFAVVTLGRTEQRSSGNTPPWHHNEVRDRRPYRDGAHSDWDAATFGGLPIYVFGDDDAAPALVPPMSKSN